MAFKLQPPETFHAAVEIREPGGTVQTLEVDFKWLAREEFVAYCKAVNGKTDPEFMGGLIAGWDADEPCDAVGLAKLFAYRPKAFVTLFDRYQSELLEVEEKN